MEARHRSAGERQVASLTIWIMSALGFGSAPTDNTAADSQSLKALQIGRFVMETGGIEPPSAVA